MMNKELSEKKGKKGLFMRKMLRSVEDCLKLEEEFVLLVFCELLHLECEGIDGGEVCFDEGCDVNVHEGTH